MTKHESPPFKMVIEGGKLVPATAYDAERLDTYRRGTKVNVVMVRDGGRVMERKWFAVLGLVVKQCNVPWKNKDQASEAVKLALGIVNLSKTVGGEFMAYPKSLVELSDPELDEAVRDMMDLIQKMTGIDPATLKKEAADVGEDEHESSENPPSSDEGSDGDPPSPDAQAVAADPVPAAADLTTDGSIEAQAEPDALPSVEQSMVNSTRQMNTEGLKAEMVRKLLQLAGDDSLTVQERLENLDGMKPLWIEHLTGFPSVVTQAFQTAAKITKGELKADAGKKVMENLL